jgi:hypothetical protein
MYIGNPSGWGRVATKTLHSQVWRINVLLM